MSLKFSLTISGCSRGIFPVLLIHCIWIQQCHVIIINFLVILGFFIQFESFCSFTVKHISRLKWGCNIHRSDEFLPPRGILYFLFLNHTPIYPKDSMQRCLSNILAYRSPIVISFTGFMVLLLKQRFQPCQKQPFISKTTFSPSVSQYPPTLYGPTCMAFTNISTMLYVYIFLVRKVSHLYARTGLYPCAGTMPILSCSGKFRLNTRLHADAMVTHFSKGSMPGNLFVCVIS